MSHAIEIFCNITYMHLEPRKDRIILYLLYKKCKLHHMANLIQLPISCRYSWSNYYTIYLFLSICKLLSRSSLLEWEVFKYLKLLWYSCRILKNLILVDYFFLRVLISTTNVCVFRTIMCHNHVKYCYYKYLYQYIAEKLSRT